MQSNCNQHLYYENDNKSYIKTIPSKKGMDLNEFKAYAKKNIFKAKMAKYSAERLSENVVVYTMKDAENEYVEVDKAYEFRESYNKLMYIESKWNDFDDMLEYEVSIPYNLVK